MNITFQDILDCRPCYSLERLNLLAGGATSCTPSALLTRTDVPIRDRVWIGCALLARRSRPRLIEFVGDCAFRADVSAAANAYAATYAADAATYAARAAAAATTYTAAYAAAATYAAAYAADAARAAATYAAADAATYDATYAAVRAERERQIRDLIRHLEVL